MTSSFLLPATALALVVACAAPVAIQDSLTCTEPCGQVRAVSYPDTVEVVVRVGAGRRLENASLASAGSAGCRSGVPVSEVTVGTRLHGEGPVSLQPRDVLSLRFPFVADDERPSAGLAAPISVD